MWPFGYRKELDAKLAETHARLERMSREINEKFDIMFADYRKINESLSRIEAAVEARTSQENRQMVTPRHQENGEARAA